jgi:hypothetical protein
MLGIIAYGSLINRQEIKGQREEPEQAIPIKLENFKRSFNQQPAWRENRGRDSAVLNVEPAEQEWLNGICFCYPKFDFKTLDSRERGYCRTSVTVDRISSYRGHHLPEMKEIFIYLGKKDYRNNNLLPNPDYLNICIVGAKTWGEDFYRDFLNTTYLNSGIVLRDYLSPP